MPHPLPSPPTTHHRAPARSCVGLVAGEPLEGYDLILRPTDPPPPLERPAVTPEPPLLGTPTDAYISILPPPAGSRPGPVRHRPLTTPPSRTCSTAVGAAPRLGRPNFPMPAYSYPAGVRIELLPRRPRTPPFRLPSSGRGDGRRRRRRVRGDRTGVALAHDEGDEIGPHLQEFDTIGQLYRSIQAGLEHLADRLGPERLFIGPVDAQATEEHFRWEDLVAVTDLRAGAARDRYDRRQGEGAQGESRDAYFGRCGILDEYLEIKAERPGLRAARPVVAANVRRQATGVPMPLITDPGRRAAWTSSMSSTRSSSSCFPATSPTPTSRPSTGPGRCLGGSDVHGDQAAGDRRDHHADRLGHAGRHRGPGFELFYQVDYLLPHREAAWVLMEERLRDAAAFAVRCGQACTPALVQPLAKVARALETYADQLLAAT